MLGLELNLELDFNLASCAMRAKARMEGKKQLSVAYDHGDSRDDS